MRERRVTGGHRAVIFRLRRSATLVIPGTLAIDVPWSGLEACRRTEGGDARPTPFQVFAHAVARVAQSHAKFRSVMVGDDRIREYDHVNMGIALARPNDELIIAVVRKAESMNAAGIHARVPRAACARRSATAPRRRRTRKSCSRTWANSESSTPSRRWWRRPVRSFSSARRSSPSGKVRIAVTFDHRLINGAAAARFLDDLATALHQRR